MDQNKLEPIWQVMKSFNDSMIEGHLELVQKEQLEKQQKGEIRRKAYKEEVKKEIKREIRKEAQNKREEKKKRKNDGPVEIKNRNDQLIEQQRRKEQLACNETSRLQEQEEQRRAYWREAVLLSEVIGPPVAKRRRAQRIGRI